MMESSSKEKAILATVSKLRRLLRNVDLATKLISVMEVKIFYTRKAASSTEWSNERRASSPGQTLCKGGSLKPSRKTLAQFAPKYFSRRRPWHHFHETNLTRLLVPG